MVFRELGRRHADAGHLADPRHVFMLLDAELDAFVADPASFAATLADRYADWLELWDLEPPFFIVDGVVPPLSAWPRKGDAVTTPLARRRHASRACPAARASCRPGPGHPRPDRPRRARAGRRAHRAAHRPGVDAAVHAGRGRRRERRRADQPRHHRQPRAGPALRRLGDRRHQPDPRWRPHRGQRRHRPRHRAGVARDHHSPSASASSRYFADDRRRLARPGPAGRGPRLLGLPPGRPPHRRRARAGATNHPAQNLAAIPAMAVAAEATSTIKIGCRVFCCDYHNAVVLAKSWPRSTSSRTDASSAASAPVGCKASTRPWASPSTAPGVRIDRLEETIAVARRPFADGLTDVTGTHVHAVGFEAIPKPSSAGPADHDRRRLHACARHRRASRHRQPQLRQLVGQARRRPVSARATARARPEDRAGSEAGAGDRFDDSRSRSAPTSRWSPPTGADARPDGADVRHLARAAGRASARAHRLGRLHLRRAPSAASATASAT